jgi:ATP-dependent exoDNAse (exonuclease V) beta subunit
MTYHGAKGLEFPMVVMFDLQKEIKPNFGVTPYSKEAFDPLFPLKNRSLDILLDDELLNEPVRQEMLEKQVDENKRLMYVGITRARDFLVIPYRMKNSEDNSQINLLATAVKDKISYQELTKLPLGKSSLRIGDKSFNLLKSELEELPVMAEGENEIFVSTPNLSFEKSGKKRKLIGSGKDKIFESPAFSGFQSETIDFKISLLDDSIKLSDSDFGNVVHNLFQQVGKKNPDHVAKIIKKWELESVFGNGEEFFNSYEKLCSSVEKRFSKIIDSAFEKSFWFKRNEQELDGIIDMVLLTEKGWVIIDYKSHSNEDTDLIKFSSAKEYLTQLNNYSEALEGYKSAPVIGAGLYYPFAGKILWTVKK